MVKKNHPKSELKNPPKGEVKNQPKFELKKHPRVVQNPPKNSTV